MKTTNDLQKYFVAKREEMKEQKETREALEK